jgi:hypothetical protein
MIDIILGTHPEIIKTPVPVILSHDKSSGEKNGKPLW